MIRVVLQRESERNWLRNIVLGVRMGCWKKGPGLCSGKASTRDKRLGRFCHGPQHSREKIQRYTVVVAFTRARALLSTTMVAIYCEREKWAIANSRSTVLFVCTRPAYEFRVCVTSLKALSPLMHLRDKKSVAKRRERGRECHRPRWGQWRIHESVNNCRPVTHRDWFVIVVWNNAPWENYEEPTSIPRDSWKHKVYYYYIYSVTYSTKKASIFVLFQWTFHLVLFPGS